MTATHAEPLLADSYSNSFARLGHLLLEPILVVGVSLFWLITLPLAALSLFFVKVYEGVKTQFQPNPLFLPRRSEEPLVGATLKPAEKV